MPQYIHALEIESLLPDTSSRSISSSGRLSTRRHQRQRSAESAYDTAAAAAADAASVLSSPRSRRTLSLSSVFVGGSGGGPNIRSLFFPSTSSMISNIHSSNTPPASSSSNASLQSYHSHSWRRLGRGTLRSLIIYICCLVVLALCLNILTGIFIRIDLSLGEPESKDGSSDYKDDWKPATFFNDDQAENQLIDMLGSDVENSLYVESIPSPAPTHSMFSSVIWFPATPSTTSPASWSTLLRYRPISYSAAKDSNKPYVDSNQTARFVEQWCDLSDGVEWYPAGLDLTLEEIQRQQHQHVSSGSDSSTKHLPTPVHQQRLSGWKHRAPALLIPGVKFAGTQALALYIQQHPLVATQATRQLELGFFYEHAFARFMTKSSTTGRQKSITRNDNTRDGLNDEGEATIQRVNVRAARARMYANDYHAAYLQQHTDQIALDATPGYLFYSSLIPQRVLCVMPWVKLLVVLRNPVDRLYEHYRAAVHKGLTTSFEAWIQQDLKVMRKAGLIRDWSSNNTASLDSFHGSDEEDAAWYDYLTATLEGSVGRGMYEIQLRHWFQALRMVDRQPAKTVMVVFAESFVAQPAVEYDRVLQFLELSTHSIQLLNHQSNTTHGTTGMDALLLTTPPSYPPVVDSTNNVNKSATSSTTKVQTVRQRLRASISNYLKPETRQQLEAFYHPYNERLLQLLKQYRMIQAP